MTVVFGGKNYYSVQQDGAFGAAFYFLIIYQVPLSWNRWKCCVASRYLNSIVLLAIFQWVWQFFTHPKLQIYFWFDFISSCESRSILFVWLIRGIFLGGDWVWTFQFFVGVCIKGDLVLVLYWSISYNKENIFLIFFSVNVTLLFCNSLSCKKVASLGCDIPTVCYMQQTWSLPHYIKITCFFFQNYWNPIKVFNINWIP